MHTQLTSAVLLLGLPIMASAQQPYSEHTMKLAEGDQPAAAVANDVKWRDTRRGQFFQQPQDVGRRCFG